LVNLPQIGTLEAFNTDGLRSLLYTIKIPCMKEKTLRYPGYAEKMRMLRETGFFSDTLIDIKGVKVKPLDLTAKLLFPKWELEEGEEELTVMRVIVQGEKKEKDYATLMIYWIITIRMRKLLLCLVLPGFPVRLWPGWLLKENFNIQESVRQNI